MESPHGDEPDLTSVTEADLDAAYLEARMPGGGYVNQIVDMTDPKGLVRCIEIRTPAGIVWVSVDLVVVRTGQPCVMVEAEANHARRPLTQGGGTWDVNTNHTPRGIIARLTRREGS